MVSDHINRYKLFYSYRPHRNVTTLLLLPNLQHYISYSCDKIISVGFVDKVHAVSSCLFWAKLQEAIVEAHLPDGAI